MMIFETPGRLHTLPMTPQRGRWGLIQPSATEMDCGVGNESFPSGKRLRDRVRAERRRARIAIRLGRLAIIRLDRILNYREETPRRRPTAVVYHRRSSCAPTHK
uniref:Uncharacterized protein n=1 Tax=Schizaphis graminum TaxID=13262 RepID=A0A2S2PGX8_SCHGA